MGLTTVCPDPVSCPGSGGPHEHVVQPTWSNEDSYAADQEGWNIFDCDGSSNAAWQLQKCDETARWRTDTDAWWYVVLNAMLGKGLHLRALDFLWQTAPDEYICIMAWVQGQRA